LINSNLKCLGNSYYNHLLLNKNDADSSLHVVLALARLDFLLHATTNSSILNLTPLTNTPHPLLHSFNPTSPYSSLSLGLHISRRRPYNAMQQHVSQDRTKKEERNDNNRGLVEHCDERKAGVAYVDCGRYVRELNRRSSFAQVSMCNCRNSRLEGSRGVHVTCQHARMRRCCWIRKDLNRRGGYGELGGR
jgi:hypothetical protein